PRGHPRRQSSWARPSGWPPPGGPARGCRRGTPVGSAPRSCVHPRWAVAVEINDLGPHRRAHTATHRADGVHGGDLRGEVVIGEVRATGERPPQRGEVVHHGFGPALQLVVAERVAV